MRIGFSLPFCVGTDICSINRIKYLYKVENVQKSRIFLKKFLLPGEIDQFHQRFPKRGDPQNSLAWLAGRWAAKEAAKKAWGADIISFHDLYVETIGASTGPVRIVCKPLNTPLESAEQVAQLSISHDGTSELGYAIATVIAAPLDESIVTELKKQQELLQSKAARAPTNIEPRESLGATPVDQQSSIRRIAATEYFTNSNNTPQPSSPTGHFASHSRQRALKWKLKPKESNQILSPENGSKPESSPKHTASDPSVRYF